METERIALSQQERERLRVLHEVKQKHLTQVAAAEQLKVTDRQVRRLLLALEKRGDSAVVHGLRGRPSNRKLWCFVRAEDSGPGTAAVRGLRADPGCRAFSQGGIGGEPRDPAEVDDPGPVVASPRPACEDHPCVAGTAGLFWRDGDAG